MEMSRLALFAILSLQLTLVGIVLAASSTTTATTITNANSDDEKPSGPIEADLIDSSNVASDLGSQADSRVAPELEVSADLLPKGASLFEKDALDVGALGAMDCHLRNVDYCYAGLMGSSSRMLPETDQQLELLCDEMKATTSCLALYNKRCQTLKVFGAMTMFISPADQQEQQAGLGDMELPADVESVLLGEDSNRGPNKENGDKIKIARCINQRMPSIKPCLEDLKTALQLFYEPTRSLPTRPTCCAMSRFRACSMKALDNICGLTSFEQLEKSLMSSSGAGSTMKTIERVCKLDQVKRHESAYCLDVLPPSGMKAPQRRGNKASKLARALDLLSFAPAAQES